MRGSRALAVVAAAGLSAALAVGAVASASASPSAPHATTTASGVDLRAVPAAALVASRTPFPGRKPAAVLALSLKAANAAASYHVKAQITSDDGSVDSYDLVIGKTGARGGVSNTKTGSFQVVRVKSALYFSANSTFWVHGGATPDEAKKLVGKWFGIKGKGKLATLLLKITAYSEWTTDIGTVKPTARVAGKVVAKLPTIGLRGADSTVFVATNGRPYPLLLVDNKVTRNAAAFTEWNKRVVFKAPKIFAVISA